MRYVYREAEHPLSSDYYYECTKTTNYGSFPRVPTHTHNYYEIYVYRSGKVKLSVEEKLYEVHSGDIMIIPPFTIHQLIPIGLNTEYDRIYLHVTEPCLSSLQFNGHSLLKPLRMAGKQKHYHFHISCKEDYQRIYERMFEMYRSKKEDYYGKEMLNRARLIEIFTLINKHIIEDITPRITAHENQIIENVVAYINEHYNEPITLEHLAGNFYMNKYSLTRLFKEQTDLTIHNYITLKRISTAKQEMMKGISPSEVCFFVGYKDYSSFYRAFVAQEQISPKKFMAAVTNIDGILEEDIP